MPEHAASTATSPDADADAEIGARLQRDARLGDDLTAPPGGGPPRLPTEILLTGATGFLGGEIAGALLKTTAARLHCVVRGQGGRRARDRLDQLCRRLRADRSRIALVEGDLADPSFAAPAALAYQVDAVVHCAAAVNPFAPYAALRAINVLGARAVLDVAARGAPKVLHFVSTAGVFLSPRYRGRAISEDEVVAGAEGLRNGYAQSRWVADAMLTRARGRGFAVTIYRPAFVGWHTRTGRAGEHDIVALLLRASLAAACAPRLDLQVNSTPVDHVAEIVARIAVTPPAHGGTYHLTNPSVVRFVDLATVAGLPIVELAEWQGAIADKAPRFTKLAALVCGAQLDPASGSAELRFEHDRSYDDARLRRALGPWHRSPPPFDAGYVARFVTSRLS